MKIAFIGGGVMAEAIISGIVEAGIAAPSDISVGEPIETRRRHLEETYGVRVTADNLMAMEGASITVLAVKPQSLGHVFPDLKGKLTQDNTVLSIVAGANMQSLTSGLGHEPIIRVMPNTPAKIGAGITMVDGVGTPFPRRPSRPRESSSRRWEKRSAPTTKA